MNENKGLKEALKRKTTAVFKKGKNKGKMSQENELKSCQVRLSVLGNNLKQLRADKGKIERGIVEIEETIAQLKASVKRLTKDNKNIVVTEHAILRYFQRVLGFDLDYIKSEILPKQVADEVNTICSREYTVGKSHKVVIMNNTVTTVLEV